MTAYYNEIDPYAAEWLRNLIKERLIPDGEVDTRSIVDVRPSELVGFDQCHFFAGIGGWAYAARLAGWADNKPLWTGSCPCQPFSVAGRGLGTDDPRHLWPHFFRLIRAIRPSVVMGEQVAGAAGYGWFDGVAADLEGEGYASRAVDVPACAVDAPHIRSRLYWLAVADAANCGWREERADAGGRSAGDRAQGRAAGLDAGRLDDADNARLEGHAGDGYSGAGWARAAGSATTTSGGDMADASDERREEFRLFRVEGSSVSETAGSGQGDMADACRSERRPQPKKRRHDDDGSNAGWQEASGRHQLDRAANSTFWSDHVWLTGADGKTRRAKSGLPLLANGIPARVGRLRAYGNAIVPQVAAQVIAAFMEAV